MESQKNSSTGEIKINDLIFKELIKRGYSLDGHTRIWNLADSKLWYLTPEQSRAFLDLEQSEDYQRDVIQKEMDLINNNIKEILKKLGDDPSNIIDLGCGDGKKAVLFLKQLIDKVKIRYCPIDISDYMVERALKNIRTIDIQEAVGFQWNISDFENIENISSLLRKQGEIKRNFFLLLGNTIGNFEITELLYAVRSAMKKGDLLLIGNGLDNRNPEEIIKSYHQKEIDEWLLHVLLLLGLERNEVEYKTRFKNSRIEEYYVIKKNKTIQFQDKKIYFSAGDQIIVAVSYKYDAKDFETYLKIYFKDVTLKTSADGSYALALCKV